MNSKPARRVLVYRIGSLGDTLVALPSLHLIEKAFPNAERVLLTNFPVNAKAPAASAVLGSSGLIHNYMRYTVGLRNPIGLLKLWWSILRYRADVLIYLMPEREVRAVKRDHLFFRLAGIGHIIGLPGSAQMLRVLDERTGLFETEAARLARSISALGNARPELLESWNLRLNNAENETARKAMSIFEGKPVVACGPGTKWQSKDWGIENWKELLISLATEFPDHGLVFVGAGEDSAAAEQLAAAWRGKKLNLCGRLSLRETAAVLSLCSLFLGPDSGPMHMAAIAGVPCAIAFSAQGKPGVWFPIGSNHQIVYHKIDCAGCELVTCIERRRECLTSISVNEMHQAALACLAAPGAQKRGTELPAPLFSPSTAESSRYGLK